MLLAKLLVGLGLDTTEYRRGLKDAEGDAQKTGRTIGEALDKVGQRMESVGKMATIGLSVPIVAAFGLAVSASSNLNESISKTGQVFDDQAGNIEAFAETADTSLGISEQAALDAASSFGALFIEIGLGNEPAAEMSTSLVTLASDLASFYNLEPGDTLEKLRSGLIGEVEPLRSMNIMLDAASTAAKAMEMGLADANGELSQGALIQARYALIMEKSAVAQGDFARTSDGLANSSRILKAGVGDLASEFGQFLLPAVTGVVQAGIGVIKWLNELTPASQQGIIALGGLAAAFGPVMTVGGQIVQVMGAIKAVGFAAWAATLPAILGTLAISLGTVVALWVVWNEAIVKTIEQGNKATGDTWNKFFDDIADSGKSATQVADEYVAAQERVRSVLENSPYGGFINEQRQLAESYDNLSQTVYETSGSYEEYRSALERVAEANGLVIDAQGNLVQAVYDGQQMVDVLVQSNYALSESEYFAAASAAEMADKAARTTDIMDVYATYTDDAAGATQNLADSAANAEARLREAENVLGMVQQNLQDAGMSGDALSMTMDSLGVAMGTTSQAEVDLQNNIGLLSQAFALGIISGEQFAAYLNQAADGTLNLSNAEAGALANSVAYQQSLRDSAAAAQELAIKQLELAQALTGATEAQIAQAAINELKSALDQGKISGDQFIQAVGSIQTEFGLVDEKGTAAAEGILKMVEAVSQGTAPAGDFGTVLSEMVAQIEGGNTNIQPLVDGFSSLTGNITPANVALGETNTHFETMGSSMETVSGKAESFSGTITSTMEQAGENFENMSKTAESSAQTTQTAFESMARAIQGINEDIAGTAGSLREFKQAADNLNNTSIKIKAKTEGFEEAIDWVNKLADAIDSLPDEKTTSVTVNAQEEGGGGNGANANSPNQLSTAGQNVFVAAAPAMAETVLPGSQGQQTTVYNQQQYIINDPLTGAMMLAQYRQRERDLAEARM